MIAKILTALGSKCMEYGVLLQYYINIILLYQFNTNFYNYINIIPDDRVGS